MLKANCITTEGSLCKSNRQKISLAHLRNVFKKKKKKNYHNKLVVDYCKSCMISNPKKKKKKKIYSKSDMHLPSNSSTV